MADVITKQELIDASEDAHTLEEVVNSDNQTEVTSRLGRVYPSIAKALYSIIQTGGFEPFATEDQLLASVPTVSKKAAKALDTKKVWLWSGSSWVDTGLSELDQANRYSNKELNLALSKIKLSLSEESSHIPVLVDSNNKLLIGYDKSKDQIYAVGLQEQVLEHLSGIKKYEDSRYIPVLVDSNNNVLIGYDKLEDKAIAVGLDIKSSVRPLVLDVNHFLFYGQSLSVGATATTVLSASQPYLNTTFNTSPRMDSAATSVIPLIEQFNNPSSDGYNNRGESPCSGAANYASRSMARNLGINPKDHIIFCSTAGHGGYRIDQLEKGTAWYNFFIKHITEAKRLNASKTYKVQLVAWVQGENDAVNTQQTSYDVYMQKLIKLQQDANQDIKEITGQLDDVKFITYQMSYAARTWDAQALVQLYLAQSNDNFAISTPMYHMPYAADNIHLTNVGYKWMGAYFGRAYSQLIAENRKPDFINPISAMIDQNKVIIKFIVPKKPLVLDVTTLANTTNYGFKVVDGSASEVEITNVEAFDNEVHLTLASVLTSDLKVRYALDYLGTGLTVTNGASGNLRDSTTDTVIIANEEKPLYHVCPHFELTAYFDKGI